MIFQYYSEARKPRLKYYISLKEAKGSIILRINSLRNQARRRRNYKFQSSRGLDCSGVATQYG
jgi:hypothetical protein